MRRVGESALPYPMARRVVRRAWRPEPNGPAGGGHLAASSKLSLAAALRERGVRLTAQRRALLALLEGAEGHLTAQRMLALARDRGVRVNRATVYRTLAMLKQAGLVDELDLLHLTGGEHFYERRSSEGHAHAGCPRCGRVVEVQTALVPRLAAEVERLTGYRVQSVRIEVEGICPECCSRE